MTAIPPTGGWTGRSVPRVEDAALLTGRGRYMDDLPIAPERCTPRSFVRLMPMQDPEHRCLQGACSARRCRCPDVRRRATPVARDDRWREGRCRGLADRRGPGALRRRAGRRDRRRRSLHRRRRRRSRGGRVRGPGRGRRSRCGGRAGRAEASSLLERQRHQRAPVSLRRSGRGLRECCQSRGGHIRYPRNSGTPIETYGVVASYDPGEDAYDVTANFQGPLLHPRRDRARPERAGNRMRLRTPQGLRRFVRYQAGRIPLRDPSGARRALWPTGR